MTLCLLGRQKSAKTVPSAGKVIWPQFPGMLRNNCLEKDKQSKTDNMHHFLDSKTSSNLKVCIPDHKYVVAMAAFNDNGYFELIGHLISLTKIERKNLNKSLLVN